MTYSGTPLPGRPVRGSATGRPIMALLDLLGRRWTLRVLWELRGAPVPSFRELQTRCGGVSSSVLTDRLAELREAGIVERTDGGYRLSPAAPSCPRPSWSWPGGRRTGTRPPP